MNRILAGTIVLVVVSLACTILPASAELPETVFPTGSILYQDDFSNPASGWDRLLTAEGIMDYDAGGYRILVNSAQTNFWSSPPRVYSDVRIEVDTGKLGGPDENRSGLVCRLTGSDYYFFIITNDGYYGIGVFAGGQATLLGQPEMQTSEHIRTGLAVNHLRADCAADTLSFYINGFLLAEVQDNRLSSGEVGLLAGTFTQPGVDLIFDNFVVLQP
ncbi:MAG: hypothetical protein FJZ87_03215 [Chloroflexi bacterium]|nr:hypothetical protein [Chloroflexota bacterium]